MNDSPETNSKNESSFLNILSVIYKKHFVLKDFQIKKPAGTMDKKYIEKKYWKKKYWNNQMWYINQVLYINMGGGVGAVLHPPPCPVDFP